MSPWLFFILAFGLVAGIMAIIWFGIPGPDNKYRFDSPTGNYALELAERCGEQTCERVAIYEETAADGEKLRMRCDFEIEADHPVFVSVSSIWSIDETQLSVEYSDGRAISGILQIDFAQSCRSDS